MKNMMKKCVSYFKGHPKVLVLVLIVLVIVILAIVRGGDRDRTPRDSSRSDNTSENKDRPALNTSLELSDIKEDLEFELDFPSKFDL